MNQESHATIWDILVEKGILLPEQLGLAKKQAQELNEPLRQSVIKLGMITEKELIENIAEYLDIPFMDISTFNIKKEVLNIVPEDLAKKYMVMPLFKIGNSITVAMMDPMNLYAIDDLRSRTDLDIKIVISTERIIRKTIEKYYGSISTFEEQASSRQEESVLTKWVEDAPVVNFVNNMIEKAVRTKASDIHIEPGENSVRIRMRVDGILREVATPPRDYFAGIISRVKIMANMNIAEKRTPQDGRASVTVEGREIDLRISTIPTAFGENMVLRLLDKTQLILPLEKLGFTKTEEDFYKESIQKSNGLILVTGPTGSGKTTTLYSTLNRIKSIEKNIITIEDPIEYQLDIIRQMQVNPKVGITFSSGLRSILRQDPDIIMVGEIRDLETARIAIQASLTGHLVFSTLHTNDAAGAITRLIDMGIEPYLIASSLRSVLAQRLVRKLCPKCRQERTLTADEIRLLGAEGSLTEESRVFVPQGCSDCSGTGYSGRIGIFELIVADSDIKSLILKQISSDVIKEASVRSGSKTLIQNGLDKIISGSTSVEEVLRVTQID
ncbi:MAG: Flp pilus assembly complex ATPase component TadA [Candidatus Aureabacteria bacterium]|nr:Flp pilus assembly complex ATPase component TadA [Candidatus Auribacterota bacterium]